MVTTGKTAMCCVCVGGDSGDVLSLADLGDGSLSISRPGPQHDDRRSLGFNLSGNFPTH